MILTQTELPYLYFTETGKFHSMLFWVYTATYQDTIHSQHNSPNTRYRFYHVSIHWGHTFIHWGVTHTPHDSPYKRLVSKESHPHPPAIYEYLIANCYKPQHTLPPVSFWTVRISSTEEWWLQQRENLQQTKKVWNIWFSDGSSCLKNGCVLYYEHKINLFENCPIDRAHCWHSIH